jgi:hypothetical protein
VEVFRNALYGTIILLGCRDVKCIEAGRYAQVSGGFPERSLRNDHLGCRDVYSIEAGLYAQVSGGWYL